MWEHLILTAVYTTKNLFFTEHIPLAAFAAPLWDAHIIDKNSL